MRGEVVSDFLDVLDEELGVTVGNVNADELDSRNVLDDTLQQLVIGIADSEKQNLIKSQQNFKEEN
jgi:hypothetical protein